MNKRKGLFVIEPYWFNLIYSPKDRDLLRSRVDFPERSYSPKEIRENPGLLNSVELLFSGWYGATLDKPFLDAAPKLAAVFFGGGSVRGMITDDFWDRNILLSSAASANAVPVAEFTLAQIILALKRVWWQSRELHRTREYPRYDAEGNPGFDAQERRVHGAYRSTIGIASLGMIGRRLRELLRVLDVEVLAYDPFATEEYAATAGIELVSLEELFQRSDVVTLHTPLLTETEGMVSGKLVSSMKPGATLINTARGKLINEPEMIEVLQRRKDLSAILDVTVQEPPELNSLLYTLPNVVLSPHIAGSLNAECQRMGRWMIEEAERYLQGNELLWEITREKAAILA